LIVEGSTMQAEFVTGSILELSASSDIGLFKWVSVYDEQDGRVSREGGTLPPDGRPGR
jgi:hypothetical protein